MICTHRTCNHHSCAQSFILFFGDEIIVKKNPKDPKHTNQNKYTNGSPNAGKVQNMMMSAIRMFFSGKWQDYVKNDITSKSQSIPSKRASTILHKHNRYEIHASQHAYNNNILRNINNCMHGNT